MIHQMDKLVHLLPVQLSLKVLCLSTRACVRACVRLCVCVCVLACLCECACVRACVPAKHLFIITHYVICKNISITYY